MTRDTIVFLFQLLNFVFNLKKSFLTHTENRFFRCASKLNFSNLVAEKFKNSGKILFKKLKYQF